MYCHNPIPQASLHPKGFRNAIALTFWLNLFFTLFVLAGGMYAGSNALIAESAHTLGDTLSVGVAWLLERFSMRTGDNKYSYGYRRFSVLAAVIISFLLIAISVSMLVSAIAHLLDLHFELGHVHPMPNATIMIVVASVGLLVKAFAAFRLSTGGSLNQRSVMFHMLMDTLSFAAILLTSLVMVFVSLPHLDIYLTLAIALWILYHMVPNMIRAFRILLQAVPKGVNTNALIADIIALDGVEQIDELRFWSLDGYHHIFTLKAKITALARQSTLRKAIYALAKSYGACDITIELYDEY